MNNICDISKIAVIAGNGDLPLAVIKKLTDLNKNYVVLSLSGFGPEGFEVFELTQIGGILNYIKSQKCSHILFCGGVKRPSLRSLKLDSVGVSWLKKLGPRAFFGDNSLLNGIKKILQNEGLEIIGAQDILDSILTSEGILTHNKNLINDSDLKDIARGVSALNIISKADVGQAIIVQEGMVLGIEAAEGTQNLIKRCSNLKISENSGILIKKAKLGQEEKIDLPTIGPATILQMKESGFKGIALEAFKTQIIDANKTIELADKYNIFIVGI